MSGNTRNSAPYLQLVRSGSASSRRERILLPPSARLERFAAAAAAAGLDLQEAVVLALEHALVLEDAVAFGLDADTARRRLNKVAANARAKRPLGAEEAAYVRHLNVRQPHPPPSLASGLAVSAPERILSRVRSSVTETAVRQAVVKEMIAWQIAATLAGRTMGEWALRELGELRSAA